MELANLDWNSLGFGYLDTDYNVRCTYKDGKWGELELTDKKTIDLHMAATCLHYGQECFEGIKAFRGKDGKIRIFRLRAAAERMQTSCRGILMAEMPIELFEDAVRLAVKKNERFVPP
jgi:branched-chain amino acid aminotransferase